ncbi:hypothetical protein FACS1894142_5570 [Spirochaetia bacterium]|nr:hypothetical protein FACS1894142_5570 [Spirochaetia bacterium]
MTHRERFNRIFTFQPVDRIPCLYFGSWNETKERWAKEGLSGEIIFGDAGPELPGMDPDWEPGMWNMHDLVVTWPIGDMETKILEEDNERRVVRGSLGEEWVERKDGSSIPHTRVHALEPTRKSWEHFKRFLDPSDPRRRPPHWQEAAQKLNERDRVATFMGGSLYGWLRSWMGVEIQK